MGWLSANGGHVTVRIAVGVGQWTVLTPCIAVEAAAKGLAPHPYVESYNEALRRRAPIETSTYLCGVSVAELLAFEMHTRGGSQVSFLQTSRLNRMVASKAQLHRVRIDHRHLLERHVAPSFEGPQEDIM